MVVGRWIMILALAAVGMLDVAPVEAAFDRSKIFEEFAEAIVSQIVKEESRTDRAYSYVTGKRARIAIMPFDEDDIPISSAAADLFNRQLEAALQRHPKRSFKLVARRNLKVLIDDMHQTGGLDDAGSRITALINRASRIDALIIGSIVLSGDNIKLGYEVSRRDGDLMAATGAQSIELNNSERPAGVKPVSFSQAIKQAARVLHDGAPDMSELIRSGVRYENSGVQPGFGRVLVPKRI